MKDLIASILAVAIICFIRGAILMVILENIFNIDINLIWPTLLVLLLEESRN